MQLPTLQPDLRPTYSFVFKRQLLLVLCGQPRMQNKTLNVSLFCFCKKSDCKKGNDQDQKRMNKKQVIQVSRQLRIVQKTIMDSEYIFMNFYWFMISEFDQKKEGKFVKRFIFLYRLFFLRSIAQFFTQIYMSCSVSS